MHTFEIFSLFLGGHLLSGGSSLLLSGRLSVSFPSPLFSFLNKYFIKEWCTPLIYPLFLSWYLFNGGCFLLLSCHLSVSFLSPHFSLLVMFFYEDHLWFFFIKVNISLMVAAFWMPFCYLSFSSLFTSCQVFFLQMVPTYEIFLFVSEWISPPWWQLSSHS